MSIHYTFDMFAEISGISETSFTV